MNSITAPFSAPTPPVSRSLSTPARLLVATLIANAALNIFLEVMVTVAEGKPLIPGILVISAGDLLLAAAVTRVRRPWTFLAAAAFLLVMMAGTVPHDLPEVLHPTEAVRVVFSLLSMLVPASGIVAAVWTLRAGRSATAEVGEA